MAKKHLARAGHASVLFIGADNTLTSGACRFAGFHRALTEVWGDRVQIVRFSGMYSVGLGRNAAEHLLAQALDASAVFCTSDEMTIGVLKVFGARVIRVPHDISIIGFDDVSPQHLFSSPITSVRQPVRALGQRALVLLLETDWTEPEKLPPEELMPVTLIERSSVAPPVRP